MIPDVDVYIWVVEQYIKHCHPRMQDVTLRLAKFLIVRHIDDVQHSLDFPIVTNPIVFIPHPFHGDRKGEVESGLSVVRKCIYVCIVTEEERNHFILANQGKALSLVGLAAMASPALHVAGLSRLQITSSLYDIAVPPPMM
ncbi:hypothetical protein E5D57_000202 [Metarhizium anisopliae]|nr:hypothetical protein E5D57_010978 [Metarhizium anisopliae]KAF5136440.1 hypothetical protein E5D57_000202 [Metarhizium anisopliae]